MDRAQTPPAASGAPQPAGSTIEARRIASDRALYTWQEFVEFYGDHAKRYWQEAQTLEAWMRGPGARLHSWPR